VGSVIKGVAVRLRPSTHADLGYITALERRDDNREHIGQWSDWEHLSAIDGRNGRRHWIIERDGERAGYLIAYDCRSQDCGFYVKRILVDRKDGGTGSAALRAFVDDALAQPRVSCVWLMVREANARGRHIYEKLGFRRFEPLAGDAMPYDAFEDAPSDGVFRMRVTQDLLGRLGHQDNFRADHPSR
jgi:ribosomal protein S18 acetylase RimI-like enzyme